MWRRAWIKISNQETGKTLALPMGLWHPMATLKQNGTPTRKITDKTRDLFQPRLCFPSDSSAKCGYHRHIQHIVSQFTVRNLGRRSVRFRSDTFQISKEPKKNRSSCLIVVSPRGSNETKETAHEQFFSIKAMVFFRDKPLIETIMTSDPCQFKLTIEGSERSSRHNLGSIDSDPEPMKQWTPATAMPSNDNFRTCIICKHITPIDTCWPILSNFEQFWVTLTNFEQFFWASLSHFEQFWAFLSGKFGSLSMDKLVYNII